MTWTNWAGDESCRPAAVERPGSVDELSGVVRRAAAAGRTVRAVGAGHSFGNLVPTSGTIVSLDALSGLLGVDAGAGLARVAAGTRLGDLSVLLAAHGLALANLGDIDRQSVGGAMSTATHGTGRRLGNLATQIEALDIMLADGSLLAVTPDDPEVLRAAPTTASGPCRSSSGPPPAGSSPDTGCACRSPAARSPGSPATQAPGRRSAPPPGWSRSTTRSGTARASRSRCCLQRRPHPRRPHSRAGTLAQFAFIG
jgi:FAD binding domain-containing protein